MQVLLGNEGERDMNWMEKMVRSMSGTVKRPASITAYNNC